MNRHVTRPVFVHEAAVYDSDERFLAIAVPFLHGGLSAGEPTLLAVESRLRELVRGALGGLNGLTVVHRTEPAANPLSTLQSNWQLLHQYLDSGAVPIRMLGAVPHPGTGAGWSSWTHYEACINDLFAEIPAWGL